jgi:DNA mismatch repair protein MSH6
MARGIEGNEIATPRVAPKKTGGSTQKSGAKQQSIAGFFKRTPGPAPSSLAVHGKVPSFNTALKQQESNDDVTPVPSSLPAQSSSPPAALNSSQPGSMNTGRNKENGKIWSRRINGMVADVLNRDSRYYPVEPVTQS